MGWKYGRVEVSFFFNWIVDNSNGDQISPTPTILKAILQVVGFHLQREWPALPLATHRTMFTPTHGCICFAWQNKKYWKLPGEIRQKILGDSGVLHIFPVTLVKRDFVWELDMGCSCRPFDMSWASISPAPSTLQKILECLNSMDRRVFKSPNYSVNIDWISHGRKM